MNPFPLNFPPLNFLILCTTGNHILHWYLRWYWPSFGDCLYHLHWRNNAGGADTFSARHIVLASNNTSISNIFGARAHGKIPTEWGSTMRGPYSTTILYICHRQPSQEVVTRPSIQAWPGWGPTTTQEVGRYSDPRLRTHSLSITT